MQGIAQRNKTGRKEIITEDVLREKCRDTGVLFISKINPNYSKIILKCGHVKTILNRYLVKGHITECQICYENAVKVKFDEYNLNYLTKFKYGDVKSSHEFRLATCKKCGDFIFAQPNRLTVKPKFCYNCYRLSVEEYIDKEQYGLLNKVSKDSIAIKCKLCLNVGVVQVSNLYRYSYSCNCNYETKPSNVYLFRIIKGDYDVLKIGKSNSPYLRSLSFTDAPDVYISFITSTKTKDGYAAYFFEKYLKEKYKSFNVCHDIGKQIIKSGFTELYQTDILKDVTITINNYGENCENN